MNKLMKVCAAAAMALSMTACTAASSVSSAVTEGVQDGVYTSTAAGFGGGDVVVTITVSEGRITNCKVDASTQTEGFGKTAADDLAREVVEAQSGNIDVVSGATATRDAVRTAVEDCMNQAGFVQEEAEAGEAETAEADVLVIGMGASGTVAAIKAAESGASVIGVEATEGLGGFGNAAQGMFAVGSVLQEDRYPEGETTDEAYWYDYMQAHNNYLGNAKLIRTFVSEAKNTISYMLNHGVKFFLSQTPQQIAHFDQEVIYHRWNNAEPFKYLGEALEINNVDVRYSTEAYELIVDENGAVTGANCTKADGGTLTVNAKSVIVATGSFASNAKLMTETLGETVYKNAMVLAGAERPGVDMMWNAGASQGELLTMNHGVDIVGADVQQVGQVTLNTPILWVNSLGKRFMNEDLLKDTVDFTGSVVAQGGIAYTIIDQATADRWTDTTQHDTGTWVHYWDRFGIIDENGNATIYHAPIEKEVWDADFKALQEAGEGGVFATLEEAAAYIGCDAEDLKETVAAYNSYVANGKDEEFGKSAESLVYSVGDGPYYVTKGHAGVLGALGGVNTTEKLEVLTPDFKVIEGLYATGNNVSGISIGGYQAVEGVGLGFSLTSGRLAGAAAAEHAGYTPVKDTAELTETGIATMEEAKSSGKSTESH